MRKSCSLDLVGAEIGGLLALIEETGTADAAAVLQEIHAELQQLSVLIQAETQPSEEQPSAGALAASALLLVFL